MSDRSAEWRIEFPSWNALNLETEGVVEAPGMPYLYVIDTHPTIRVLESNAELINANIRDHPIINGRWYRVAKTLFNALCNTLRNHVRMYNLEDLPVSRNSLLVLLSIPPFGPIDPDESGGPMAVATGPSDP